MSTLKQLISSGPAHSRVIEMHTYPIDEATVVVEGWLKDKRYFPVYDLTGEEQQAGPVHQMVIRILVAMGSMEILDAEAEMLCVPHEQCRETLESIKKVVGLRIVGGFTKKVQQRIGGKKGCSHMTHLLTVMSQEVFQGTVVVQRQEKKALPEQVSDIPGLDNLIDSCQMWRHGGVKLKGLQRALSLSKE